MHSSTTVRLSSVQPNSSALCFQEEMSSSARERGRGQRRKRKKEKALVSERNKIASERKEPETPAICESGTEPNHCPQSPGTCLTESFCNGSTELLPQTTGPGNHTRKNTAATRDQCTVRVIKGLERRYLKTCNCSETKAEGVHVCEEHLLEWKKNKK